MDHRCVSTLLCILHETEMKKSAVKLCMYYDPIKMSSYSNILEQMFLIAKTKALSISCGKKHTHKKKCSL